MYKFTNGIVVYDKETRDKYISAGMTLVVDKEKETDGKESGLNGLEESGKPEKRTGPRNVDAGVQKNNKASRR